MRAFVINKFGQPGTVGEVPDPVAGEGEVLVRVHAASINPMDVFVASGATRQYAETRLPLVPGIDASGVVEKVGPNGNGFKPGDEVILNASGKAFYGAGTFAELVTVPSSAVVHKPSNIDDDAAATLPLAGLTALAAVDALDIKPDQVVAIIGGTGGVGSFFTQLASHAGAHVVSLARPENSVYAAELGADDTVDYTSDETEQTLREDYPNGLDALADFSGNADLVESVAGLLRTGGRLVSTAIRLDADAYAARGITAVPGLRGDVNRLPELVALVEHSELKPPPARVVSLEETGAALAEVGEKHTRGKIVIHVAD